MTLHLKICHDGEVEYITADRVETSNESVLVRGIRPGDSELLSLDLRWVSGTMDDPIAAEGRNYQKFPAVFIPTNEYSVAIVGEENQFNEDRENQAAIREAAQMSE